MNALAGQKQRTQRGRHARSLGLLTLISCSLIACQAPPTLPPEVADKFTLTGSTHASYQLVAKTNPAGLVHRDIVLPLHSGPLGMLTFASEVGEQRLPLPLLFDTGSEAGLKVPFDDEASSQFVVVPSLVRSARFASITLSPPADVGFVSQLALAGETLSNVPALRTYDTRTDVPRHGFAGMELLRLWRTLAIDLQGQSILLSQSAPTVQGEVQWVPLRSFREDSPLVGLDVEITGIGTLPGIIDTGITSDLAIGWTAMMNANWEPLLIAPRRGTGRTATQTVSTVSAVLATPIRIGPQSFTRLRLLTIDDRESPEWAKVPLIVGQSMVKNLGTLTLDFAEMRAGIPIPATVNAP